MPDRQKVGLWKVMKTFLVPAALASSSHTCNCFICSSYVGRVPAIQTNRDSTSRRLVWAANHTFSANSFTSCTPTTRTTAKGGLARRYAASRSRANEQNSVAHLRFRFFARYRRECVLAVLRNLTKDRHQPTFRTIGGAHRCIQNYTARWVNS
jgi:hypothetical protein